MSIISSFSYSAIQSLGLDSIHLPFLSSSFISYFPSDVMCRIQLTALLHYCSSRTDLFVPFSISSTSSAYISASHSSASSAVLQCFVLRPTWFCADSAPFCSPPRSCLKGCLEEKSLCLERARVPRDLLPLYRYDLSRFVFI